jgi:hypothetical protein
MIAPSQRLVRMRASFDRNFSILADDYRHFTTPRVPTRQNKAERKLVELSGQQSQERSETPSSDRTVD